MTRRAPVCVNVLHTSHNNDDEDNDDDNNNDVNNGVATLNSNSTLNSQHMTQMYSVVSWVLGR